MCVREAIKDNDAFKELAKVYQQKENAIEKYKKAGKKVVGYLGNDVPDELLIAADYLPVRISGNCKITLVEADKYLEYSFDPVVRSQFQKIVDGSLYALMDHLVISNSTDVLIRLYYYLREIRRIEPEKPIPPIYFLDMLFTRTRTHQVYNFNRMNKFKKTIETWIGKDITEKDLKKSIDICNENRDLLRQIEELRICDKPRITGMEALHLIGSSMYMPKQEHSLLLKQFLESHKELPDVSGKRIFVTGSVHEDISFYELVERAGAVIVAEDHDMGNRYFDKNVETDSDLLHSIVNRYMLRMFSPKKAFVSQRVAALKEQIERTKPDGVIFFMRQYDDPSSWDYPEQAKMLKELNIPSLLLVRQPHDLSKADGLKEKVEAFISALDQEKGGCKNE
ncbi:MAG TPA: 2-hydroxyacyl-CoA dehydratase [Thermoanaerobacterales bacterium]|nr:2-hydroxyacyl-CoA dehydratase [Thermoanaerobacterales bacterium]